ncbi:hypothetical protein QE152_g11423 [Popillia japonica]|uniref:Uncharacterized protein n=1 Tax=Popillia japonica TaxID=7064 RepID=A0AAW1LS40_POPJA
MIYAIIDPFALCQVAYEEVKLNVDDLHNNLTNYGTLPMSTLTNHNNLTNYGTLPMSTLTNIIEESTVLISIVTTSIQDIELDNFEDIEACCKDIKSLIHEIKCCIDVLIVKNKPTRIGNERIIKRCKVIKGLIKKLLLCLAADNSFPDSDAFFEDEPVENRESLPSNNAINKSLDYITSKSKEMIKERSILYRTPKSISKSIQKNLISLKLNTSNRKPMPLSKLVHLRNMQFSNCSKVTNESSLDLQITAILADLENLSQATEA